MRALRVAATVSAAAALLALAACGGGGGDSEVICVGGCPAQGMTVVDDAQKASLLAQALAQVAVAAVPTGTYTGKVVSGLAGSASFTGHSSSGRSSCGSGCSLASNDTSVAIVFIGFRTKLGGNMEVTLDGAMTLTDDRSNRTTGSSSSSSGSVAVRASNLVARNEITAADGRIYGQVDTVTVSLSSAAGASWRGSLATTSGHSYAL